ncbi:MAG: ATP-binding protein [Verrucomicrobiales bacterium]
MECYLSTAFNEDLNLFLLPSSAHKSIEEVLRWQYGPKGLFIAGISGWGKTRSALALAKRVYVEEGKAVRIFECGEFYGQFKYENSKYEGAAHWLADIIRTPLVILDELGSEKPSPSAEAALLQLISQRASRGLPSIITTNCTLQEFANLLSDPNNKERIPRRLRESCKLIVFQ